MYSMVVPQHKYFCHVYFWAQQYIIYLHWLDVETYAFETSVDVELLFDIYVRLTVVRYVRFEWMSTDYDHSTYKLSGYVYGKIVVNLLTA